MKRLTTILFSLIIIFVINILPASASNSVVIRDLIIDEAGRILMVKTNKDQYLPKPEVSKVVEPNRLILDVPNSILATQPKTITVNNNGIRLVRMAQYSSGDDKKVRIVIETEAQKVVDKIKISASNGSTMIQLQNLPSSSSDNFLTNNNLAKITKIDYRDGQLIVGSLSPIKIKDPFILQGPSRLVVDIPNAQVSDKTLLAPIVVAEQDVDVVRIGQFDDTTVRLVIETDNPNRLYPIYGADQQTLYITSNPTFSVANLPKGVSSGYIKDIKITEDEGLGTIVKIESSSPLAHRIKRLHEPEKLVIDLINAAPPSEEITKNLRSTQEILDVKVGQLMAGNPNSRIVLNLNSPSIDIKTNVSTDGKIMEIVLKQSSDLLSVSSDGTVKVVLDAGHGGYDTGCQAEGYKEKDITLDVTKRVKVLLEKANIKVYMTRSDDSTLSLKERTEFTNSINPAAFVSIHVNASESTAPEGIDTHWYTNQSIPLARNIQNSMMKKINAVDRGIKKNMFYVIHHTPVPSTLVEIGFLSNSKERRDIITFKRKQNTAQAIAEGVIQFLGTKYSFKKADSKGN
ncbi:MAG: N-acetylmuramoyl-L-alanine amidase [Vampirovibrionia bacterium]